MWTELRFGKHKGRTLPRLVFSDPDYFFWAYDGRIFEGKGAIALEAKKIFDRATRIRIRQDGEEKVVAEYLIHAPTGTFGHLQLVPESQPRHEGSSPVLRMDVIDLSVISHQEVRQGWGETSGSSCEIPLIW